MQRYVFFLLGQVGLFTVIRYFYQYNPKFVSQTLDGSTTVLFAAGWMSAALLGFRIFDGVTDPLAGGLSDRWVRAGRKRGQRVSADARCRGTVGFAV